MAPKSLCAVIGLSLNKNRTHGISEVLYYPSPRFISSQTKIDCISSELFTGNAELTIEQLNNCIKNKTAEPLNH